MDKNSKIKDAGKYPGIAVDVADDEKTPKDVDKTQPERLNNNPRDHVFNYK